MKIKDYNSLISRAIAAIETPKDLNKRERNELIEDLEAIKQTEDVKYKVWLTIEKVDYNRGTYEDVSPFPVMAGEFDSVADADACIVNLTGTSSLK